MHIEKVKIRNFCQHTERDDVLEAGVVGILGRNGSGKSNYLRAIKKALTGTSGSPGKQEEDIQWGANKGTVEVSFVVGGQPGMIRRQLKSSSCLMKYAKQSYKTAKAIDGVVYDILEIRPRVLTDVVFVEQGKIEGLLFQSAAERSRSLQALFGTEDAERIRELLAERLKNCVLDSRADSIARLKAEILGVDVSLSNILDQAGGARRHLLSDATAEQLDMDTVTYHEQQVLLRQQESATGTVTKYEPQLERLRQEYGVARRDADSAQEAIDEVKGEAERMRAYVMAYAKQLETAKFRAGFERDLEEAKRLMTYPPPEPPPFTKDDLQADEVRHRELSRNVFVSSGVVKAADDGDGKCPTCHQELPVDMVTKHQLQLDLDQPELKEVGDRWNTRAFRYREYENAELTHKQRLEHMRARVASLQKTIESLPQAEEVDAEVAKAYDLEVGGYDKFVVDHSVKEQEAQAAGSELEKIQAAYDEALAALNNLQLDGKRILHEEYQGYKELLELHRVAELRLADLQGSEGALKERREQLATTLAKCEEEERRLQHMKTWRDMLERARLLLHRDQLPNLVAQEYVKAINERMGNYLESFGVPYSAAITPEMAVQCVFPGNRTVPATRLSGGQKVMLGVAFRFAVYDLFVGALGLMILDEPTTYLDEDNIECVYELLEKVKSYSKASGMQIIVVTHEQRLRGVFDRVIEL